MNFFEKMFHPNKEEKNEEEKEEEEKKENLEQMEEEKSLENEEEKMENVENSQENEKKFEEIEDDIEDLENLANEIKEIDPEKVAKNLEKNEELKNKLKVAASVLTTLGFGAALVLSFTERVDATNIAENVPGIVNEIAMGVSFLGTAISGAVTQLKMEKAKMNNKQEESEDLNQAVA